MTTPEDDLRLRDEAPNWQKRPAPGPRPDPTDAPAATEGLAAHLWGEPEDDDA